MFVMFSSDLMCIVCLSAVTSCEVASLSHWDLIYSFLFSGPRQTAGSSVRRGLRLSHCALIKINCTCAESLLVFSPDAAG